MVSWITSWCCSRRRGMTDDKLCTAWYDSRTELKKLMHSAGDEVEDVSKPQATAEKMRSVLDTFQGYVQDAKDRLATPRKICWLFDKRSCFRYTLTAFKYLLSGLGTWIVFADTENTGTKATGITLFAAGQVVGLIDDVAFNKEAGLVKGAGKLQRIVDRQGFVYTVKSFLRVMQRVGSNKHLKGADKPRPLDTKSMRRLDSIGWGEDSEDETDSSMQPVVVFKEEVDKVEKMSDLELLMGCNTDYIELQSYMQTVGDVIAQESEKTSVEGEEVEEHGPTLTFPETRRKMENILRRFDAYGEVAKTRVKAPRRVCWLFNRQGCLKYTLTALKYIASNSGAWIVFEDSEDVTSRIIGVLFFVVGQLLGVLDDVVLSRIIVALNNTAKLQRVVDRRWFAQTVRSFLRLLERLEALEDQEDGSAKEIEIQGVINDLETLEGQFDVESIKKALENRRQAQKRWSDVRRRIPQLVREGMDAEEGRGESKISCQPVRAFDRDKRRSPVCINLGSEED